MLVEGLGSITFVNGVLSVQLTSINAEGKFVDAGSLEIPGAKVGDIIQGLANGSQGIIEKLNEDSATNDEQKSAGKSKSKKTKNK